MGQRSADLLSQMQRLQTGGGGGTSDGMEPRVAKLEADVGHILTTLSDLKAGQGAASKDLTDLKVGQTELKTTVGHLPSKEDISKTIKDWALLIGAILAAINVIGLLIMRFVPTGS
ncbi:hypothetical protein [Brevundimonas sp. GCM10030266]|uniref:hypothetical protein n=1 Tax=Brevundimonas sp. GCM10030266 TaxID=3273386 RepID=UPI003620A23B